MSLAIQSIANEINAKLHLNSNQLFIDHVSIDSRSLQNFTSTLFFCLVGEHHNGHQYIEDLKNKGVQNFVVSELPINTANANFLLVNDTLKALQDFAIYYRNLFQFPVIGITGSNGKTIVKEWLNFLLSPEYNISRSPKSYNSQVGVPLSVIGINQQHNFGIFEAGISLPNEMQRLEQIIKPNIGILTNIGSAHNEGFTSLEQKTEEKLKLFKNVETLIYPYSVNINPYTEQLPKNINLFSWSFNDKNASVYINKQDLEHVTLLEFNYQNQDYRIALPFVDSASVENAVTALMTLLLLKYPKETIQKRIEMLYPIEMRLQVKNGANNTTIIDDSYSSDYQSLKIALDFLEIQKQHPKKSIILSDILQSGWTDNELYQKVAMLLQSNHIHQIIGIGKRISSHKEYFSKITTFDSTDEFLQSMKPSDFENQTVLIKGARNFHFENIVNLFEEKTHQTVLEINLNAISHNLNYFKSKLQSDTKLMVMIKAFAYGSGSFEIARLLEYHKVDYLGVAFTDEGITLRKSGIKAPIIVMNPESTSFATMIQHQLEPEIYSIKELIEFINEIKNQNHKTYPIHIKIDSGMHRLGFENSNINELIEILNKSTNWVEVKSIFSHLATSDMPEYEEFTLKQINTFKNLAQKITSSLDINPILHIANTSAISNYTEHQLNMVRLGIGLYGISNDEAENKFLQKVGTLKSVILQIKEVEIGESVGYGRRFIAERKTKTATIPIGYADGIRRDLGLKGGYVTIKGKKAPILGSICMDMLMVDITEINCKEGDEVIIFGEKPNVIEMAKLLDTIPYEILSSISTRVKRVFYRE